MSRPTSINREAILQAARKVFLRHGYGAGTKQVSEEAGVSEGSLFKHFKTKNDLFMAAMETDASISSWEENLMKSAGHGNLRKNLTAIGMQILEHLQIVLPCMIMVRSRGFTIKSPKHCEHDGVPPPVQRMKVLGNFFREEVRLGRLKMDNPQVYAQIFIGTLVHYIFFKTVFSFNTVKPETYVKTVVEMILKATTSEHKGKKG